MGPNTASPAANAPSVLLILGRSPRNQLLFWLCVALAGLVLVLDLRTTGRTQFPTWGCLIICLWQALRTFVACTILTSQSVVHRSVLGVRHELGYRGLLFERRGAKTLILHGRNQAGTKLDITLSRRDGDLDKAVSILANLRT